MRTLWRAAAAAAKSLALDTLQVAAGRALPSQVDVY